MNYASVFVPLVSSKGPSPSLLTCCYLKSGSWGEFPKGIESSGNKSVESAFDSMRALEKGVDIRKVRIFADKPMTGSIGSSASLGIALALWCASRKIDDASELSRLLALKYLVTGHLLPDGSVKKIKNLCLKEKLVRERRSLIAPYGNRQEGISFLGVNTWDDAKARISPDHIIPVDSDEFPDCDVLIGVASKQTEPHLQLIDILKPRKKIIFLHSVD
ncbi:MAG: hypothetical protein WCP55_02905 [Lentisphaerota bacterium]